MLTLFSTGKINTSVFSIQYVQNRIFNFMELILEIFFLWIREKYFFFCTFALKEMTYVSELRPIVWAVEDIVYLGFAWFLFHFRYTELLSFLNNLQILLQLSLLSSTAVFCWRTLFMVPLPCLLAAGQHLESIRFHTENIFSVHYEERTSR